MADEDPTPPPLLTAKLKGYRKWHVDAGGRLDKFTARYQAIRNADPAGTVADIVTQFQGIPAIGTAIDTTLYPDMIVRDYSIEEGDVNGKRVLYIDVNCSLRDLQDWNVSQFPPAGQAIQEISLTSGSVSRDLVADAITGKLVLNSAGQPFDSVPQVDRPSPTFRKVVKVREAKAWAEYMNKVNASPMTISGIECASHVVRCVQADKIKLWNDEFGFVEQWTIGLQLMSNRVAIAGETSLTQIGWDIAVVDQGTMSLQEIFGEGQPTKLMPIMTISAETGKEVAVSQPVLLDGQGHAMLEPGATPYAFRFSPYPEATFPTDFYSES